MNTNYMHKIYLEFLDHVFCFTQQFFVYIFVRLYETQE